MDTNKNESASLNKGGALLLYMGIAMLGLAVFSAFYIPPVSSKMFIVDDGKVIIANANKSPERFLSGAGTPIKENDILQDRSNTLQGDRLFVLERAREVQVCESSSSYTANTTGKLVRNLIEQNREMLKLGDLDRVEPSPDTPIENGMVLKITRVTTEDFFEEEPAEPGYKMIPSDKLPRGRIETVDKGKPGLKEVTYRKFYKDGEHTLTKKIDEKVVVPPTPGIKHVGSRVMTLSRSGYRGNRMLVMEATAYDAGPLSTGKWADGKTATGAKAKYGVVAVDPDVIPLGTKLFVEGYGYALACDVGGAIKGLRIDLFFESRKEALKFGRRDVKVYVINEE